MRSWWLKPRKRRLDSEQITPNQAAKLAMGGRGRFRVIAIGTRAVRSFHSRGLSGRLTGQLYKQFALTLANVGSAGRPSPH